MSEFRGWLEKTITDVKWQIGKMSTQYDYDIVALCTYQNVLDKYDNLNQKVVVPQCVADWYEENKNDIDSKIYDLCVNIETGNFDYDKEWELHKWFLDEKDSIETLTKMKLFGYEVQQEKKYAVQVPHEENRYYYTWKSNLCTMIKDTKYVKITEWLHFTEKEIREMLPDVPEKYWIEIKS